MQSLFLGLLVLSSIVIIISTILMEPKSEGMGSLAGQETNVFGKSASRGKEKLLTNLTVVSAVIFMVSSIMIAVLK